tara:strand:+ start:384 stop:845 length:462 start_codon:yes stop_codon:yes gene_type:complete
MNKQQRSNLAKTAIFLIEKAKDEHFDMHGYSMPNEHSLIEYPNEVCAIYNECGTTCCFAGHGPMALRSKMVIGEKWNKYNKRVFGVDVAEKLWLFLFDSDWVNSRKQAASRALIFLEKGLPEIFSEYKSRYLTSLSNKKLVERLEAFVITRKR